MKFNFSQLLKEAGFQIAFLNSQAPSFSYTATCFLETLGFVSFLLLSGHCNSSILIVLLNFYSTSTHLPLVQDPGLEGSCRMVSFNTSGGHTAAEPPSLYGGPLALIVTTTDKSPSWFQLLFAHWLCLLFCKYLLAIFTFFSSQVRETLSLPSSLFYTKAEILKSCSCETFCFHLLKFWGYLGTFIERIVHGILNLQSHCSV